MEREHTEQGGDIAHGRIFIIALRLLLLLEFGIIVII